MLDDDAQATRGDLKTAIANLATKDELKALATKDELAEAVAKLATKDDVNALATKDELAEAVAKLATKDDLAQLRKDLHEDLGLAVSGAMEESRAWFRMINDQASAQLAKHAADTTLHRTPRRVR